MYTETLKNYFIDYILLLIIGIAIYSFFGIAGLIIFSLLVIVFKIDSQSNYLRKMIRINNLINEVRVLLIMKKLNIPLEEAKRELERSKENVSERQWEQIEKDWKDISHQL